jgi:ribosomal protein S18 acetylase RimI-like enzyme
MSEQLSTPDNTFPMADYEALFARVFPEDNPDDPVLGATSDVVIAPNLAALLVDSEVTLASQETEGQLAGFSLAMPISRMYPARSAEVHETAYIYYTAIAPDRQGQGLVEPLMRTMVEKLRTRGYSFIERDCRLENGYADKVQAAYAGAIIASHDHETWPEAGPERFFRIDLRRLPEIGLHAGSETTPFRPSAMIEPVEAAQLHASGDRVTVSEEVTVEEPAEYTPGFVVWLDDELTGQKVAAVTTAQLRHFAVLRQGEFVGISIDSVLGAKVASVLFGRWGLNHKDLDEYMARDGATNGLNAGKLRDLVSRFQAEDEDPRKLDIRGMGPKYIRFLAEYCDAMVVKAP